MDLIDQQLTEPPSTEERGTRVWLITFTDLVALMLAFFVMLFAMSSVKVTEWRSVIDSLSQTLRPTQDKTVPAPTSAFNIGIVFRKRASDLDYLTAILEETVADQAPLAGMRMLRLEDRLVIALPGDAMFFPDGATLTLDGEQALFVLGGVLRNIGNRIGVDGHARGAGAFESAWELSAARAAAVANALRQAGYTDDIVAFGHGDGRDVLYRDVPEPVRGALVGGVHIVVRPEAGEL